MRPVVLQVVLASVLCLSIGQSEEANLEDSKSAFQQELDAHRECLRLVDDTLRSLENKNQKEMPSATNIHPNKAMKHSAAIWVETMKNLSAKVEELDGRALKMQTEINKLQVSKTSTQMAENKSDDRVGTVQYSHNKKIVKGFILATEEGVVTVTLPAMHRTKISNSRTYLVAFDWNIQKVYWLDTRGIKRAILDGTDAEIFLKVIPMGLAVDSITGNVYYTSPATREIRVCSRDGEKCSVLVTQQKGITTLAVYPSKSLMFWTNDTGIVRANLDGTNATVLLKGFLRGVDESSDRLYWEERRYLASCDFNGHDGRIILNNADYLSGVANYEDVVFFSNGTDENVRSTTKNGGNPVIVTKTTASVNGIAAYGQVHGALFHLNPCENSPCSHFCVLKLESFACLCTKGKRLDQDGTSCVEVPVILE